MICKKSLMMQPSVVIRLNMCHISQYFAHICCNLNCPNERPQVYGFTGYICSGICLHVVRFRSLIGFRTLMYDLLGLVYLAVTHGQLVQTDLTDPCIFMDVRLSGISW
jgi:hypothetical protein